MIVLNPNQKRLPIGGHHFPSHGITFKADTFNEVVDKLTDFRISNGIKIGNPKQEIINFYAVNWPFMVQLDESIEDTEPSLGDKWYQAWQDWVIKTWGKAPRVLVPNKEASTRWEICRTCPHNKGLKKLTGDEAKEIKRRAMILRKGFQCPDYLGYCDFHKCDLSVFTFIDHPIPFSSKEPGSEYEKCWVK